MIQTMDKESILKYLTDVKAKYQSEGFLIKAFFGSYSRGKADANGDVDILVKATPGFGAIARIHEIQAELSKTGKKFIIDRAIYV